MTRYEVERALAILLGRLELRNSNFAAGQEAVDWAVSALVAGWDSAHLRVLAGMSEPFYRSEIEQALHTALAELNIALPAPDTRLWIYARLLAQDILDERLSAPFGCCELRSIGGDDPYRGHFYGELSVFIQLCFAWHDLQAGKPPYDYYDATRENFAELAKQEARGFLTRTESYVSQPTLSLSG